MCPLSQEGWGQGAWPSLMVYLQPSTIWFGKRFDLNNLFFLFKGSFSAHHLLYFWIAMKIQWGSNFFEGIPLFPVKSYFWLPDLPVLLSLKALILSWLLLCSYPKGNLLGTSTWLCLPKETKQTNKTVMIAPSCWKREDCNTFVF